MTGIFGFWPCTLCLWGWWPRCHGCSGHPRSWLPHFGWWRQQWPGPLCPGRKLACHAHRAPVDTWAHVLLTQPQYKTFYRWWLTWYRGTLVQRLKVHSSQCVCVCVCLWLCPTVKSRTTIEEQSKNLIINEAEVIAVLSTASWSWV